MANVYIFLHHITAKNIKKKITKKISYNTKMISVNNLIIIPLPIQ